MIASISLAVGLFFVAIALLIACFFVWAAAGTRSSDEYEKTVVYDEITPAISKTDRSSLTIVTYNLGYLSGLTNNLPVRRDAQLFETNLYTATTALSSLQPDILALQEVDLDARRSFRQNQAQALAQLLNLRYGAIAINWDKRYVPFPYWPPAVQFGRLVSGQAVLTQLPVIDHRRVVLQKVAGKPFLYTALYLDRLAQIATLELDGQPLVLINVHLEAFDEPTRHQQTETVRSLVESFGSDVPLVVLGDFNSAAERSATAHPTIQLLLEMPSLKPVYDLEMQRFSAVGAPSSSVSSTNAQHSHEAIATFPSDAPAVKLDYIFYTPAHLEPIRWRVIDEAKQASDHLPVMAEFRVRSPILNHDETQHA